MSTPTASLVRSLRTLSTLLCVICFLTLAEAQHGGGGGGGGHSGGGHSGGGHSGGGHSSGGHSSSKHAGESHPGGHFGWLHFGKGKHSARNAGFAESVPDTSAHQPSHMWNLTTPHRSISRIPPTLLWSPPMFPTRRDGRVSFVSFPMRHHRAVFNRFRRFSSSGCFFNGVTQVCFFEPLFPLLFCSGDFGFFDSGFGGDSLDLGDGLNSQGLMQSEISAIPATAIGPDDDPAEGNSPAQPGLTSGVTTEERDPGKGVFLLVLNNGASHAVTDYWVADGYLEYISPDGTRSHIPLEALDLQSTVTRNAPRGLPFVLRSTPAENR
jgi:hypothetical protein